MTPQSAQAVGTFLVTPLTRRTESGDYTASVSVRRGMHDRIFRFIQRFDSHALAAHYALDQGRHIALNGAAT
ncbi:hypothetical protein M4R22_06860 [Acidovorax sp. GBBC 3334]|uniref:hypothetical protein n=1 Tax=Acidovorax sp. GBBC 3334 TaxID=2940496 RepID=UPI0023025F38|nr:hypothetical protein [Acidovorax sp. GBBC 3334]MDA8454475.1 hypothetical protein [Acidovorax sp. GBBC 3334]